MAFRALGVRRRQRRGRWFGIVRVVAGRWWPKLPFAVTDRGGANAGSCPTSAGKVGPGSFRSDPRRRCGSRPPGHGPKRVGRTCVPYPVAPSIVDGRYGAHCGSVVVPARGCRGGATGFEPTIGPALQRYWRT